MNSEDREKPGFRKAEGVVLGVQRPVDAGHASERPWAPWFMSVPFVLNTVSRDRLLFLLFQRGSLSCAVSEISRLNGDTLAEAACVDGCLGSEFTGWGHRPSGCFPLVCSRGGLFPGLDGVWASALGSVCAVVLKGFG